MGVYWSNLWGEKILISGIFSRGVMVGAAELMRLNRLQMLKESRGQQCKRPDSKRVHKQETLQAPQGTWLTAGSYPSPSFNIKSFLSFLLFLCNTTVCVKALPGNILPTFFSSILYLLNLLFPLPIWFKSTPLFYVSSLSCTLLSACGQCCAYSASSQWCLCVWITEEFIYWKHECKLMQD